MQLHIYVARGVCENSRLCMHFEISEIKFLQNKLNFLERASQSPGNMPMYGCKYLVPIFKISNVAHSVCISL